MNTLQRIALSDLGVLIVGEEGTGKKWLAKMIHEVSGRAEHPFLRLDCEKLRRENLEHEVFGREQVTHSGIEVTRGVIERSFGGTVFFENVEEIPTPIQMRIARILEHQHFRRTGGFEEIGVNVRIITATRKKPDIMVDEGDTRNDIYFRMCPVILNLPPLRERREDIPFLIEKFIVETTDQSTSRPRGMTGRALRACLEYHWPGNAKELRGAMEHALGRCSEQFIRKSHLPVYLQEHDKKPSAVTLAETERP